MPLPTHVYQRRSSAGAPVTTRTIGTAQILTGTAAALAMLHFLRAILIPFVIAFVFAVLVSALVRFIQKRWTKAPAWAVGALAGLIVMLMRGGRLVRAGAGHRADGRARPGAGDAPGPDRDALRPVAASAARAAPQQHHRQRQRAADRRIDPVGFPGVRCRASADDRLFRFHARRTAADQPQDRRRRRLVGSRHRDQGRGRARVGRHRDLCLGADPDGPRAHRFGGGRHARGRAGQRAVLGDRIFPAHLHPEHRHHHRLDRAEPVRADPVSDLLAGDRDLRRDAGHRDHRRQHDLSAASGGDAEYRSGGDAAGAGVLDGAVGHRRRVPGGAANADVDDGIQPVREHQMGRGDAVQ